MNIFPSRFPEKYTEESVIDWAPKGRQFLYEVSTGEVFKQEKIIFDAIADFKQKVDLIKKAQPNFETSINFIMGDATAFETKVREALQQDSEKFGDSAKPTIENALQDFKQNVEGEFVHSPGLEKYVGITGFTDRINEILKKDFQKLSIDKGKILSEAVDQFIKDKIPFLKQEIENYRLLINQYNPRESKFMQYFTHKPSNPYPLESVGRDYLIDRIEYLASSFVNRFTPGLIMPGKPDSNILIKHITAFYIQKLWKDDQKFRR